VLLLLLHPVELLPLVHELRSEPRALVLELGGLALLLLQQALIGRRK
jgi:hypothetical protein